MTVFGSDLLLLALALGSDPALDDAALSARIRAGDKAAFKAFFDRHHESLYRFLVSRGLDAADAEELIQTAFVIVWEKRTTLREGLSLRSFLFTIAWNRALNLHRDRKKFDDNAVIAASSEDEGHVSAHEELEGREVFSALERAVAALPEKRRMVFELCFLQGLPYREAAEALEVSVKTVENQMGHALKAIREAMRRYL